MKVLRSGIDLYVQKCICGCIFAYSKSDTVEVRYGIQEYYDTEVECPECHKRKHAFFFDKEKYRSELENENRN